MILAGLQREGGGQHDRLRAARRQRLKQGGKANVVADRAAEGQALGLIGDDGLAGLEHRAFAIGRAVGVVTSNMWILR